MNFKRNKLIFSILLCVAHLISHGQTTTVTLTGTVTDEMTGELLPFANVYINNSSIGTTTNEKGAYTLANLPIGNLDMAVSYLGYVPIKQTLRFEQPGRKTVLFKMRQGVELESVVIRSKRSKKWQRQFKVVTRELLGTGKFAKLCKILNPEVLRITMEDNGHLLAQSTSPLKIENRALGYMIYQDLSDFDFYENTMYYGGNTRFELLKPENEEEKNHWRANQKVAYQGSLKQLLTGMVSDSLRENGFQVFQQVPDSLRALRLLSGGGANANPYSIKNYLHYRIDEVRGAKLIRPGELETERLLVSGTKLEVFDLNKKGNSRYADMPYAYSLITLPQGYAVISPQGWVVVPMGMEVGGDLANDRFANLLPSDWQRD
ncbi:carboxypeptidase-like regulatory domain-containing protein [Persicitalea sp.]|uniref:carboxypeptidase-like regulatory domain-containing protein n=1 Tax=Persicitalea sp. TaxID=3100273 RepID=UPI003593E78F